MAITKIMSVLGIARSFASLLREHVSQAKLQRFDLDQSFGAHLAPGRCNAHLDINESEVLCIGP
jgi:hypothetical protein